MGQRQRLTGLMTIQGNGSTVRPASNFGASIFEVSGAEVIINNLSMTNGSATNGAAILNNAASLLLSNVSFSNNIASRNGGAVYNNNGYLYISDSTFVANRANIGAAIFSNGVAAQTIVVNTEFSRNEAVIGGAIRNEVGALSVSASSFRENRASAESSAISLGSSGSVSIQNSVITENLAENGAALTSGNTAFFVNGSCIFANESASSDVLNVTVVGSINATGNWWGSPNGPNQPGADTVSTLVLYEPFLTEAPAICAP
jgi:hypothetical protein